MPLPHRRIRRHRRTELIDDRMTADSRGPSLLVSAVDLGLKPSAVLACHLHQRTKADRRPLVRPRRSARTPPSQVRLRNRPRFGIAEDGREGGCSHASPRHPVNIPHDNEDRGVVTGFDEERIHRSASLSHPPPQFTKHPGPPSQGGNTGSNPVGTTSETAGQEGSVSPARAVDPSTCRNRAAASRARASSRSARSSRPAWCCSSILVEVWLSRNATRTGVAPTSSANVPAGSPQAPRSLRSLGGPLV